MEVKCPHCNMVIEKYTPAKNLGDKPSPGDLLICVNCLSLCKYEDDLSLNKLTTEEVESLPAPLVFEMDSIIASIKKKKASS